MSEIDVKYLLDEFEKQYPNALNRAFNSFKARDYENFSIQDANLCLLGQENDCPAWFKPTVENLRIYTLWQYDKIEFDFDMEQIEKISLSTKIERRKFNRQPFKSYYVKLHDLAIDGFFVATKYFFLKENESNMFNSNEVYLSLVLRNKSDKIYHINFDIDLLNPIDLMQSLENAWYKVTGTNPTTDKNPKEVFNLLIECAMLAVNIVYYISDLNNDRPEYLGVKNTKDTHNRKPKDSLPSEYTRKFIIPYSSCEATPTKQHENSASKQPHVRSEHWHHYWIGARNSENRKRIIKWLESTTVNTKQRDNLPIVNIKV